MCHHARFDLDYQWQPGKDKALFMVAKILDKAEALAWLQITRGRFLLETERTQA